MKHLILLFMVIMFAALLAFPALADFETVTPVAPMVSVVSDPVGDEVSVADGHTLSYIVGAVVVALAGFATIAYTTRSLVAGYETFITRITTDEVLGSALQTGYKRLPIEAKEFVDIPIEIFSALARLTPSKRDDELAAFLDRIRGSPGDEAPA